MLQFFFHYFLHFIAIGLIAWLYSPKIWMKAWLILIATMLVDVDHIFATPILDHKRCGIGYHPLHSEIAIGAYILGIAFLKRQTTLHLIAIGLLFHMITDSLDCIWTFSKCNECFINSEIYKYFDLLHISVIWK